MTTRISDIGPVRGLALRAIGWVVTRVLTRGYQLWLLPSNVVVMPGPPGSPQPEGAASPPAPTGQYV
jgi:hypothetical protein